MGGMKRRVEKLQMAVAWALPKWLWRWATVRAFAAATTGAYSHKAPDSVTYSDVMAAIDGR